MAEDKTSGTEGTEQAAAQEGGQQDPQQGGASGTPDWEKASTKYKAERDDWKSKFEQTQTQLSDLQKKLDAALTSDDVKKAVEDAKSEAKKAYEDAAASWSAKEKSLVVENQLIAAGCSDTVGLLAHVDMAEVEVASDGHVAGIDVKSLKETYPYLFKTAGTVSSAMSNSGTGQKMTRDQIMAIKDRKQRQEAIKANLELFED